MPRLGNARQHRRLGEGGRRDENDLGPLHDRYSPAVRAHESFKPTLIRTPKDEYVLDFGQNMAGWVEFDLPALEPGSTVKLSYSEVMQDGCFYRDDLRTAEAQYTYTTPAASSSGKRTVYFEFLYICVSYAGRRPDYFCGFSLFLNVYVRPTLSSVRVCTSRFCARL